MQDLLCGGDGIGVAVERFGIDADHLAALLLRGLVQLVQLAQLSDTGLAAAEPEVHDRVGVVREQAVVDRIPVEILARKLRERTGRGRFALAGAVVGGQGRDLLLDRADALGIAFQRLIILIGELVLTVLHRAQQDIAVVFRRCGRGFVHGGENLIPQLLMCAEDGVFLLEQLCRGLAAGIGSFRAGLAARSGAQQQAQAEGKGGCTFEIHL